MNPRPRSPRYAGHVDAPTLVTERLTLRPHRRDDFRELYALWSDPEVTRFISGPSSEEDAWARLMRYAGHWALQGYGYWAARETATGRFVGDVGFADHRRTLVPALDGAPEAGWVLATWSHGRGFATEAVRAAQAWAATRFDGARTVCLIAVGHEASLKVAARCGYREYARSSYKGSPVILLEDGPAPPAPSPG